MFTTRDCSSEAVSLFKFPLCLRAFVVNLPKERLESSEKH